jgi:hypothetical protein
VSARRLPLRLGATALLAGAAFATTSASAGARGLVAPSASCGEQAISKVFSPWNDYADYTPLSGGDFEGAGEGWSTTRDAVIANGNSPYQVGGEDDTKSLSLPARSSATSAPICIGVDHPTLRLFAKRHGGGWLSLSMLRVDVLFENAAGTVSSLPIGLVLNGGSWRPTSSIPLLANRLLAEGEHMEVRFRFTAYGADWSIDDIWVDPYHRR